MKTLTGILTASMLLLLFTLSACNSQTSGNENDNTKVDQQEEAIVTVYYFHGDRRCTTCKAVGSVSKETIVKHFSDDPRVIFKDINIEEAENNEIKDRLEMSGSGLFVYDGSKKVDLTAIAFQKAVSSPDKLSEKLLETVNEML